MPDTATGRNRERLYAVAECDIPSMTNAVTMLLPNGGWTIIDADLYAWFLKGNWRENWTGDPKRPTARDVWDGEYIYLSRVVANCPRGMQADHRNRNTRDNRRCNLRVCTQAQNNMNVLKRPGCSSRFKGVSLHKPSGLWFVQLGGGHNGAKKTVRYFADEIDAARCYNDLAREYYGEFAILNEIDEAGAH